MTEAEWLACGEPKRMLGSLFSRIRKTVATDERFRRFAIACCRRVADVLEFGDTYALDCMEIYATSQLREALLKGRRFHRDAGNEASTAMARLTGPASDPLWLLGEARVLATSAVWTCTKSKPTQAAMAYSEAAIAKAHLNAAERKSDTNLQPRYGWLPPDPDEQVVQAALLRDVFGNPFRPVSLAPEWRTDTAVAIARGMYEARDFGAMPILADALQDAGCDSDDILSHCRDAAQVHVRGCWVVDLMLGKE